MPGLAAFYFFGAANAGVAETPSAPSTKLAAIAVDNRVRPLPVQAAPMLLKPIRSLLFVPVSPAREIRFLPSASDPKCAPWQPCAALGAGR